MAMGYPHDEDGHVVEGHHLLSGGIRIGHFDLLGLCLWHHKGRLIVNGWTHDTHRRLLGPSLAEGSVPFHDKFGSDDQLLAQQVVLNERKGLKVIHPDRERLVGLGLIAANDSAQEARAA